MSRPPIVAKEIQTRHNGTIFTIQVTLVGDYNFPTKKNYLRFLTLTF